MGLNRRLKLAAAAAMAFCCAIGSGIDAASAQGQVPAPEAAQPSAPPGFIVTPPRPLARPHIQEFHYRLEQKDPESEAQQNAPQSGGCRYEERKLELLV